MLVQFAMALVMASAISSAAGEAYAPPLGDFVAYEGNPVFEGAGPGHWDERIRERGWILREDGTYHMWYTGYSSGSDVMKLGYATSPDGFTWTRYSDKPIYDEGWVEDMTVLKVDGTYYMFAEGRNDVAHLLASTDRVHWTEQGNLDIRKTNGEPLAPGPYGTPAVLRENGRWYLLYERKDEAIWLAVSDDLKVWTNVQDEPVITCGPEPYDRSMIAMNQVVKHEGQYYAYYHATCPENPNGGWTMNAVVSPDLIRWKKHPGNPILGPDLSSGILVDDGTQFRMYTMHRQVEVFFSKSDDSTSDDEAAKRADR